MSALQNIDDYKPAGDVVVLFKFNSAKLTDDAKQQLDQTQRFKVGSMKRYFVAIQGFTDKIGTPEYNLDLSRRRAQAVQTYLWHSTMCPYTASRSSGSAKTSR